MEKVKNFQRNYHYLESEKFFSKFSFRIFLKGRQNYLEVRLKVKVKIFKPKSETQNPEHHRTPQNTPEHLRTPQNTSEHLRTPQKPQLRIPQNISQNTSEYLRTHSVL
jgi:hypothetical protein